jgi:3',5'-nucleoside bisphosphate phosphatase
VAYDLHTHSLCSDGTRAPAEVVTLAADVGLSGLALTDHDTCAGWDEARRAALAHDLEFVPGIELSAERGEQSVHLLGFWIDAGDAALAAECVRLRGERAERARAMIERLSRLGVTVDERRVRAIAGGAPIGRPHVAAALVEAGAVPDLDTAFDRYLADGGPAWVPKHALDPVDAVTLIRAAGGTAVLAHPALSAEGGLATALLDELAAAGLAGVEADHPHQEPAAVEHWRARAAERGLLVTGGSDFHGARKTVKIGACTTARDVVEALRERRAVPTRDRHRTHGRRRPDGTAHQQEEGNTW